MSSSAVDDENFPGSIGETGGLPYFVTDGPGNAR